MSGIRRAEDAPLRRQVARWIRRRADRDSGPCAAPVLATDERGGVRNEQLLALRAHREEAAHDGAGAGRRPAAATPGRAVEGIEAVVDRDLVTGGNRTPGEDLDAMAHGVRIAGVVEVAAWRREHREAIESELAQMDAFPLAGLVELLAPEDSPVSAPEYELAFLKRSTSEDASALGPGVTNLDIADHAASVGTGRLLLDRASTRVGRSPMYR